MADSDPTGSHPREDAVPDSSAGADGGKKRATPAILVTSKPVKTTVGFGVGSFTRTESGSMGSHRSANMEAAMSASEQRVTPSAGAAPSNSSDAKPPKPTTTKAERRELQEKQRAEKEKRKQEGQPNPSTAKPKQIQAAQSQSAQPSRSNSAMGVASLATQVVTASPSTLGTTPSTSALSKKPKQVMSKIQADDERVKKQRSKALAKQQVPERTSHKPQVTFFSHLHQYERTVSLTKDLVFSKHCAIHPAIVRLGLKYSEGVISGSNARCIALMAAFKVVIQDYRTPAGKELSRDLNASLQPYISFLEQCRPLSVSMGNAIKHVKHAITHEVSPETSEDEAKRQLIAVIDKFVQERIVLAQKAITDIAVQKIEDGDVILVYSSSSLLFQILHQAMQSGKQFRIIVVDSHPKLRGAAFVERCAKAGIKASYTFMNAVSYVMREATKVFLAAHALLANGYVMNDVGTSMIAMMAKACNIPVLVCCETYKFCERVQTDSFVFNELGDPDDLTRLPTSAGQPKLSGWTDIPQLKLLNLTYDVTPPVLVDMVITDLGAIPCTSVPVVLRVKEFSR